MRQKNYLVWRRDAVTWGMASAAVRSVAQRGSGIAIHTDGGSIGADAILGVDAPLEVTPLGVVLRHFWPEPGAGLAVWAGTPLVVVDELRLPHPLRHDEGESEHA
ncbi:MAG: hypothetical protein ACHQQS_16120 [Thermoanaerobaculales bacterium]